MELELGAFAVAIQQGLCVLEIGLLALWGCLV